MSSNTAEKPMMRCGHAANAIQHQDGGDVDACAICFCTEVAQEKPDLTGRFAKCAYQSGRPGTTVNHTPVPSSWGLAFFEFQGEGSHEALDMCGTCRYAKVAHGEINVMTGRAGITDHEFVPRGPAEFDRYYCGCWGWD